MFNYYIHREEDVNLKEKVLRKGAITSNVLALRRSCEVRNCELSAKIKILAKREHELTTKFAIARNGC